VQFEKFQSMVYGRLTCKRSLKNFVEYGVWQFNLSAQFEKFC